MEATMAAKITVVLEEDLDGGPVDVTVRLGSVAPTTRLI
jgi:hypothetical protein